VGEIARLWRAKLRDAVTPKVTMNPVSQEFGPPSASWNPALLAR